MAQKTTSEDQSTLEGRFFSELLSETPAPEVLHRPGRNRLGPRARPVDLRAGLDHRAGDAVQVQFHGGREPDRAAAGNEDRHAGGEVCRAPGGLVYRAARGQVCGNGGGRFRGGGRSGGGPGLLKSE